MEFQLDLAEHLQLSNLHPLMRTMTALKQASKWTFILTLLSNC